MLRINIPLISPETLTFTDQENHDMPQPPHGVIKKDEREAVLLFDDEAEAIDYADHVEELCSNVSRTSPEKGIMRDVASAIYNDEHVRSYLE